jgi:hypothetical protein
MPKGYDADGKPLGRKRLMGNVSDRDLEKLIAEGWRIGELGKKYGVSRQTVLTEIRRRGVPYSSYKGLLKERNGSWKGGRMKGSDGYWLRLQPDHPYARKSGYVLESRLVMEKKLGRHLLPTEVVDHIDGDIDNNSLGNLRLFRSNSRHLGKTLKGKVPHWTKDGKRRILEAVRKPRSRRKKPNHARSRKYDVS